MNHIRNKVLAGILAGTMALSAYVFVSSDDTAKVDQSDSSLTMSQETAQLYAGAPEVELEVVAEIEAEDDKVFKNTDAQFEAMTLNSAAAYDQFYGKYGYDKVAYVFYNGKEIPFTLAYPLIQNGVTFVPLADFAKTIGATTEYIPETHSVVLNYQGDKIAFDINDTKFYVNDGAAQELPYATFVASDSTMVPLRFIMDAFGLDLYWNDAYRQVIAADVSALKEGIDSNYTLMNGLLAFTNGEAEGKNIQVAGDFAYEITIDGKTMTADSNLLVHANDDLSGLAYEMDFAVDLGLLEEDFRVILKRMTAYPEEDAAMIDLLFAAVEKFDFNYIYDLENLDFYLQSDLIPELLPILSNAGAFSNINAETWFKLSLSDFMSEAEVASMKAMLSQLSGQGSVSTMDEFVDVMMEMTRYQDNYYSDSYGTLMAILEGTSDDKFTKDGDSSVVQGSYTEGNKAVYYTMTVETEGDVVTSYTAVVTMQEAEEEVMRVTLVQEDGENANLVVEGAYSGVTFRLIGDFQLLYTEETAATKPEGSVFDLTNYF